MLGPIVDELLALARERYGGRELPPRLAKAFESGMRLPDRVRQKIWVDERGLREEKEEKEKTRKEGREDERQVNWATKKLRGADLSASVAPSAEPEARQGILPFIPIF